MSISQVQATISRARADGVLTAPEGQALRVAVGRWRDTKEAAAIDLFAKDVFSGKVREENADANFALEGAHSTPEKPSAGATIWNSLTAPVAWMGAFGGVLGCLMGGGLQTGILAGGACAMIVGLPLAIVLSPITLVVGVVNAVRIHFED